MNPFARDLLLSADPVSLGQRLGVELFDWQREVVRSPSRRRLLLCSRQSGKTTTAALMVLHNALYRPGSLTVVTSSSQRQATILFGLVANWYRQLGSPVAADTENALSLRLENGSRVVALPGDPRTVRGYSGAQLVVIDEAAFCDDELFFTILPMVSVSRGTVLLMSTPFGRRGFFFEAFNSGDWTSWVVPVDKCAHINQAEIESQRATMGEWRFRQEFLCEFVEAAGSFFNADDIAAMFGHPDVKPLFEGAV